MNKLLFIKKFNFLIKSLNHSYDFWLRWWDFDSERKNLFETIKTVSWIRLKRKIDIIIFLYKIEKLLINYKSWNVKIQKIKVKKENWRIKRYNTVEIVWKKHIVKLHEPQFKIWSKKSQIQEVSEISNEKMKKIKIKTKWKEWSKIVKNNENYEDIFSETIKDWELVYTKHKYSQLELNDFIKREINSLLEFLIEYFEKYDVNLDKIIWNIIKDVKKELV